MRILLILSVITLCFKCYSQNEFKISKNGLIYSDSAISKLKYVVDSLNLKFKYCDLNKAFMSSFQGQGHFITIQGKHTAAAKVDIDNDISYQHFIEKYNKAEKDENLLITKYYYTNWSNEKLLRISNIRLNKKYPNYFNLDSNDQFYDNSNKGKWVYKHYPKAKDSEEWLNAFYLIDGFKQFELPQQYARMVMYADCLVDTSATIYFEQNKNANILPDDTIYEQANFMAYIDSATLKPQHSYNNMDDLETLQKKWEETYKKDSIWDSLRFQKIDSLKQFDITFSKRFTAAIEDAIQNSNSDDEFEEYVGYFVDSKTALELKRNRKVIGGCSQDSRPRIHALNIAKLSAETFNWEIFLRSHLDIMNDNFQRATDGSYAWAKRKTYIKELEVLDIDVLQLLFGITFQIENPSQNHYFSKTNRTGRAFSEYSEKDSLEKRVLEIIADENLDELNRLKFYFLFDNYIGSLEDKSRQSIAIEKLKINAKTFPEYIYLELIKD